MIKDLDRRENSKENYRQWQFIGYYGSMGSFEGYYDSQYNLYWLWYKNDGWGGADCCSTEEELDQLAEDFDYTCW